LPETARTGSPADVASFKYVIAERFPMELARDAGKKRGFFEDFSAGSGGSGIAFCNSNRTPWSFT
jgi:hypothetical protein